MMMPSPHARPGAQGGFTLVELLVAIALMAMVSIISWRGLEGIAGLRDRLEDDAMHTERLLGMLGQLERDLALRAPDVALRAAVAPLSSDTAAAAPRALPLAIEVMASSSSPKALRLEIIRADAAHRGAWQRVAWWREGASLWRAVGAPATGYPLPEPGPGIEVMPDVVEFAVHGWISGTGWAGLPLAAGSSTPVTGLDVIVRRGPADAIESYNRVVALQ